MNIQFIDPPPRERASAHPWASIAEQLRENPNRWALCVAGLNNSSYANQIRTGKNQHFRPAGAFDAETRGRTDNGKRVYDLYIRFNGEQESAENDND